MVTHCCGDGTRYYLLGKKKPLRGGRAIEEVGAKKRKGCSYVFYALQSFNPDSGLYLSTLLPMSHGDEAVVKALFTHFRLVEMYANLRV